MHKLLTLLSPEKVKGEDLAMLRDLEQEALACWAACQNDGLMHTAGDGAYTQQLWARDLSLTSLVDPLQALRVIRCFLRYQRPDGAIPYRIEGDRHIIKYLLGKPGQYLPWFTKRGQPAAIYHDSLFAAPALDTVPAIVIAFAEAYTFLKRTDPAEAQLVLEECYIKLVKAIDNDAHRRDANDYLYEGQALQDWMDDTKRTGKLSMLNVLYYQAHRCMVNLARDAHDPRVARYHVGISRQMRRSIRIAFWNEEAGYYVAGLGDPRLDVPANIFASMWLATAAESARIHRAIESITLPSGLVKTFDKAYPWWKIRLHYLVIGFGNKFANHYVYPWITQLNMLARLRLAERLLGSPDTEEEGQRLLAQVTAEFLSLGKIHKNNQGFCEVLCNRSHRPARFSFLWLWGYPTTMRFAGTFITFLAVHSRLVQLGVIPK